MNAGMDDPLWARAAALVAELGLAAEDAVISVEPLAGGVASAIALVELADSSVNLAARPWANTEDYWAVKGDLMENVKRAFDANGISIPYPQQDVHMHQVA